MRFLVLALALCVACGDSDDDNGTPTPDAGPAGDAGSVNQGGPAYLVVQRIFSGSERLVILTALPNLDQQTVDPGGGLELSGFSRAFVFNGRVYTFDGESGEVTRYAVSPEREFVREASFSMAGVGVVRFRSLITFINPDRAYYLDIPGEQVVVFSPSEMSITATFDVPEVNREGFDTGGGTLVQVGDEILAPVNWTDVDQGQIVPSVAALVLSATEDRLLRVVEDPRCVISGGAFVDGGQYYLLGHSQSGFLDVFAPIDLPPPCLVRGSEGQDELDQDFVLNLREAAGAPHMAAVVGRGDGTAVLRMFDPSVDQSILNDPQTYFGLELWIYGLLNISTGEVRVVDALPRSGITFDPAVIDGSYYVQQLDEENARTTLYRLNDDAQVFESITLSGDILNLERIR